MKQRKNFLWVVAVLAVIGGAWFTHDQLTWESTDDAYVQAHVLMLAPRVAGTVSKVLVDENEEVKAGQVLVQFEGQDYATAQSQAQAEINRFLNEDLLLQASPQQQGDKVTAMELLDRASAAPVLTALKQNPTAWVDFMMRFELGLEKPAANRAQRSALTIAGSYIAGGLIPLLPYMLVEDNLQALRLSTIITLAALALFGALKGKLVGTGWLRSAIQTTLIGGTAAAVAFGLARLLNARHM